ncbi:MAG: hypothetical protein SD837_13885 [Candidatus Electrothrix scaldis]|nr:MAG: hypothetical protein SD837_13885 [Candidatus Electrothrix sp. GW3-3]
MKVATILRHPLSNTEDVFSLEGDCICCGKAAADTWTYHRDYKLEQWVARPLDRAGLVTAAERVKDRDGKYEKGHLQFSAPLCAKHLRQTRKLRQFETIELSLVAGFILLSVGLYITAVAFDWPLLREWRIPPYVRYFFLPLGIFFLSFFSGIISMTIINMFLSRYPLFHDYPLETNAGGFSGLGLDINQANQKERGRRAKYEVVLNFTRDDAATQFLSAYPQAVPVESQVDYFVRKMQLNRENKKYTGDF